MYRLINALAAGPWLLFVLLAFAAPASAREPEVMVVGNSIAKLTTPYLIGPLSGVRLEIWTEVNSNSNRGIELAEHAYKPSQSALVFDSGTTDPAATPPMIARSLRKVAALVGDDCIVVPTIEHAPSGAERVRENRAIFEFAASRPGTQVPEWSGLVAMRPKLWLQPRDFHANHQASTSRARLVRQAIHACLAFKAGHPKREPKTEPTHTPPVDRISERLESASANGPAGQGGFSARVSTGSPHGASFLVSEEGHTLYYYGGDRKGSGRSTCLGACAKAWPPLITEAPPSIYEEHDVNPALLGTIERPNGAKQVTYGGHPLYTFSGDRSGLTNGLGKVAFGAEWLALRPNGRTLRG